MSQPLTRDSAVRLTIAGLVAGVIALSTAVWKLRDETERRDQALLVRVDQRLSERLSGYVTRETRAEDREALNARLYEILMEIRRRR